MHTDPELLSLLALGEQLADDDVRAHLEACPECAAELAELQRVVTLARSVGAEAATMTLPSPDVWARIRDELDLAPEPADRPVTAPSTTLQPTPLPSTLQPNQGRVRRSPLSRLKAVLRRAPGSSPEPTARAQLTPVEATWSAASGTAEIATDEQGRRLLTVALTADLPASGVRQAWLVHRQDPTVRQTLGILDGPHGLWTIEHSIDLNEYGILDISQQVTGETEHSGHTIVRGELTLAG
jgi:hypothetical protein